MSAWHFAHREPSIDEAISPSESKTIKGPPYISIVSGREQAMKIMAGNRLGNVGAIPGQFSRSSLSQKHLDIQQVKPAFSMSGVRENEISHFDSD
jgi:hypothetical protein